MKGLKFYFKDCRKSGYCLGAYNFNNMETLKGICKGCEKSHSPAFLSVSEGAFSYMDENFVKSLFKCVKKEYKNIPLFLHLDHGKSFDICKKAIDLDFDSVMIDGSALDYNSNLKLTKKVCNYAHKKCVFVEAELGMIAGIEDTVETNGHIYTDPKLAREFVEKTGCDTLAVAIGTSHGAYKFHGEQKLRFDILKQIETEIPNTPLVLHGASSVPQKYVKTINDFGGKVDGAIGIPEKFLTTAATKHNIFKINCDTDIRLAYFSTLRKHLTENPANFDIRKPNILAIEEIANFVAEKNTKVFKNSNRC